MSFSKLSKTVFKVLCSNSGSLDYEDLLSIMTRIGAVSDLNLKSVLSNHQLFLVVPGPGSDASTSGITLDSRIISTSSIRLCKKYPNKECRDCGMLHLCRFFILGNCKFGVKSNPCKHSHDIHDFHNWNVLSMKSLQELSVNELRILLLQNDPSFLPEICLHYNKGNETLHHGICSRKEACNKLHICSHYVSGSCKFGDQCRRSHSLYDDDICVLLRKLCLDEHVMQNLLKIYQNRNYIKQVNSTDGRSAATGHACAGINTNDQEICLYFIRKHCSFKEKCIRDHFHLPYRWQIYKERWEDLPNMEEVEMDFCDPNNITSSGICPINFETMMFGSYKVRRLSTASSVTKPPDYILTTEWLWYAKNASGKWTEYESQDQVCSADLEKLYLAEISEVSSESSAKQSFKEMCQKFIRFESEDDFRRRPRFVSKQDVEKIIQRASSKQDKTNDYNSKSIPENWDKSALVDLGFKRIQLLPSSEEYKKVQALFQSSMQSSKIQKIDRIQNVGLWEIFQWKKEQMRKMNGAKNVNERLLFHGITTPAIVDDICFQNFELGTEAGDGSLYGKGIHFAEKASCCFFDMYSGSAKEHSIMFLARVLVGEFAQGHRACDQLPSKDGTRLSCYDSCVDNISDPSIFVIFEKYQIYPEYVIEYNTNLT
ncbi:protein mono-ADP-ribosyltransferase PARP12-like isoform X1 [Mobula birostris]|uniref:protein mono-ADP-ribosyltransferase PARP12-like isoform X1 n=1 Tax=Mobula birostris TaxID=1983395 RepID=UPI003B281CB3